MSTIVMSAGGLILLRMSAAPLSPRGVQPPLHVNICLGVQMLQFSGCGFKDVTLRVSTST
jgi:hypothetical protein